MDDGWISVCTVNAGNFVSAKCIYSNGGIHIQVCFVFADIHEMTLAIDCW